MDMELICFLTLTWNQTNPLHNTKLKALLVEAFEKEIKSCKENAQINIIYKLYIQILGKVQVQFDPFTYTNKECYLVQCFI